MSLSLVDSVRSRVKRAAVVLVALFAWSSADAATVNVSQYVQKGLVACWDGQASAPTASGWTDTSGQHTWTWTDTKSQLVFNGDSVTFPGSTTAYGTLNAASSTAAFDGVKGGTIELVFKTSSAGTICALQTPKACGPVYYFEGSNNRLVSSSGNTATWSDAGYHDDAVHTVTLAYNTTAEQPLATKAWRDGAVLSSYGANGSVDASSYTVSTLGGRTAHNNSAFNGTIYAIRVYNRVLTDGELAVNAELDNVRFGFDGEPSAYTWPEGVRWNGTTEKVECRVKFATSDATAGTITSTASGGASADHTYWYAMNTSDASVLPSATATAAAGAKFIRWTGVITGVADITATTVTFADITEPRPLTALFQKDADPIPPDPHGGDDYATIAAAITAASAGDTVELAEGTFHLSQTLTIAKAITLKGAGMNKTIIRPTKGGYRGFYLDNKSAVVEGVQATGFTGKGEYSYFGIGFYVKQGKVSGCRATANKGGSNYANGTGFYLTGTNSSATNCVSDHNVHVTGTTGTGFFLSGGPRIYGCLAYENSLIGEGTLCAAIHVQNSGSVYSSTVVGSKNDGGIYLDNGGFATNCVSALNSNYPAHLGGPDAPDIGLSKPSLTNSVKCCLAGRFAELRDPANGDYRLRPALASLTNAGYRPYDPTEEALDVVADDTHAFVGSNIVLTAVQTGKYAGKDLVWEVKEADGTTTYPVTGTNPATVALPKQGRYTVTLTAEGETPCVRTGYLYVRNLTNELAVTGVADELPAAVDKMIDGETLILGAGTYPTTRPVYVTNNVTIVGKGWDKTTVSKTGSRGVFIMSAEKSHLTGCTVTGGAASDYYNITGSGVRLTGRGGKVSWCRFAGNKHGAYYTDGLGVGMESVDAWVTHCIISNNLGTTTLDNGGGVCMKNGLLENSLIVDNTGRYGGGLYVSGGSGKIRNCTIAKNTAGLNGGGVCGYRPYGNYVFTDCVIAENTADSDTGAGGAGKPNWSTTEAGFTFNDSSFVNCAIGSPSTVKGDTSISVNAPFVDSASKDFHLDKSCKAVEGGVSYDGLAAVDLDGKDRMSGDAVDMGCYEVDMTQTSCSFEVSPTVGFTSAPLTCTPIVISPPAGKTLGYRWTFRSGAGVEVVYSGASPSVSIAQGGVYTVTLEVYDVDNPEKVLASNTRPDLVRLACKKVYAVGGGVNPKMAEPFDTWEKAHTNLNELETYLIGGCEVELGEGVFTVTNHLVLNKELQYHGAGLDKTVINCAGCRGFYLNDQAALVENLTVSNGNAKPYVTGTGYNEPGLGILIGSSGGTVRGCRITGSYHSSQYQRGSLAVIGIQGHVSHCIIDHNTVTGGDDGYGGLYMTYGTADNCLVYSNKSTSAGGLAIVGNDNSVWVSNCTFVANEATSKSSGGLRYVFSSYGPKHDIVNCIFAGNKGVFRETTLTGGGQYDINELDFIWSGGYHWGDNKVAASKIKGVLKNCCFQLTDPTDEDLGTNTVNADPKFADAAACDYRLLEKPRAERSPCIDAGAYVPWMLDSTDLDGRKRVKKVIRGKGRVDMGCYESDYRPVGLMLLVR